MKTLTILGQVHSPEYGADDHVVYRLILTEKDLDAIEKYAAHIRQLQDAEESDGCVDLSLLVSGHALNYSLTVFGWFHIPDPTNAVIVDGDEYIHEMFSDAEPCDNPDEQTTRIDCDDLRIGSEKDPRMWWSWLPRHADHSSCETESFLLSQLRAWMKSHGCEEQK